MTNTQFFITVIVIALSIQLTRALPFFVFGNKDELPKMVEYLGKVLPASMMGLLIVYCYKDFDFTMVASIVPALIAATVVVGIHLWKRNTVLSIVLGTVSYMVLIKLF